MKRALKHFPPKWLPVRRKKCGNQKNLAHSCDSKRSQNALNLHDHTWKFVFFAEITGFGYLFWAVSNAAHVSLISF